MASASVRRTVGGRVGVGVGGGGGGKGRMLVLRFAALYLKTGGSSSSLSVCRLAF